MENKNYTMEELVAAAKSAGFVYQGSEIYGGLANSWDYGPLGSQLKTNLKNLWWKEFISKKTNNVGLDSSIIMNTNIWRSSGHIGGFSDPLIDCKECNTRHRADKLIEDHSNQDIVADGWTNEEMSNYLIDNNVVCPNCGKLDYTDIRQFDLMFKTNMGVVEDDSSTVYLRPETAQGIFVNFKNIQRTSRKKLPFGVGQIGKSFRNEITPGNFIFRTREFEQMELEFFCKPGTDMEWFGFWKDYCYNFLLRLGMKEEGLRMRDHSKEELSHYSKGTSDIEFKFPFGFGELWGIANRTDFDLKQHQENSNEELLYFDQSTNEKYLPYVIEPSVGLGRLFLAFLCNAYDEEIIDEKDTRVVLRLHPAIAPIKVAILPLSKKLSDKAVEIYGELSKEFNCDFDETGSIGKRYRRQDEIGTPFCITYDFESEEDGCVTVRFRDTMEQERIKIGNVKDFVKKQLDF